MKKFVVCAALAASGCSLFQSAKAPTRAAEDLAAAWCAAHFAGVRGLSVQDAEEQFCSTVEQLKPWLDLVLSGEKNGVEHLGVQENCR